MHTIDGETSNLEQYVQYIDQTCCRMIVRNWTACSHFGDIMAHKLRQIRNTWQLLSNTAQREDGNRIPKRGLFNFVGKISKAEPTATRIVTCPTIGDPKKHYSLFPNWYCHPFPLGKDCLYLMYRFSDVRVYVYLQNRLGYEISVPLVHKRTFTMLRMIPIPVPVDQEHFLYIDVRGSVLCLDQTKQYYFAMTDVELSKCKLAEPGRYVCTHQLTLLSTVTTCAVTLLHKRDSLPPVCETRLIRLSNTVWTQLSNNSWIFYTPHPDVITILCYDHSPL